MDDDMEPHRAHLVCLRKRALERALPRRAAAMAQQLSPTLIGRWSWARTPRRGGGPALLGPHAAVPQGAGLVRPVRRDRRRRRCRARQFRSSTVCSSRSRSRASKTDTVRKAWYPYTHPFNLTGHPAMTLPCGFHSDGLPWPPARRPPQRGRAPVQACRGTVRAGAPVGRPSAEDRGSGLDNHQAD